MTAKDHKAIAAELFSLMKKEQFVLHPEQRLIDRKEVARLTGLSESTIRHNPDKFPYGTFCGRALYSYNATQAYIQHFIEQPQ